MLLLYKFYSGLNEVDGFIVYLLVVYSSCLHEYLQISLFCCSRLYLLISSTFMFTVHASQRHQEETYERKHFESSVAQSKKDGDCVKGERKGG